MNIRKAILLDIISIKPYLTIKNLVLLIVMSTVYSLFCKNPILVVSMTQIFSLLFSSYPFMVGEETGIDPLFKIMGIKSDEVVKGRYFISMLFVIIMLIVGMILAAFISMFYPVESLFSMFAYTVPLTFIVTTLIIFIEFPVYFKVGYLKGRALASMPFLILGVVIIAANMFSNQLRELMNYLVVHRYVMLTVLCVIWCLVFFASITLSQKYYKQRDF